MRSYSVLLLATVAWAALGGCANIGGRPAGGAIGSSPAAVPQDAEVVSPRDFVLGQAPQRAGMHACERGSITQMAQSALVGRIVTGVRADRNELLCTYPFRIGQEYTESVIPNTQTVMCRRPNHFVTGLRADRLEALCAPILAANLVPVPLGALYDDPPSQNAAATQRRGMHACPYGSGLVGFTVDSGSWTFHCAAFPICWYFNVYPTSTPCANRCVLPSGIGSRQGVCN